MAILGLLAREDDTLAGIGRKLTREFPRARFARSVVHNSLASLERQRLVCLVERGRERSLDRYRVSRRGREVFARWLRDFSALTPVVRDGWNAKLAFVEPDDVAPLIAAALAAQRACAAEYASAHARLLATLATHGRGHDTWRLELRRTMIGDEVALWLFHVKRLQRLCAALEVLDTDRRASRGHGEEELVADATVI